MYREYGYIIIDYCNVEGDAGTSKCHYVILFSPIGVCLNCIINRFTYDRG